jgi:hypothetical protein
MMRVLVAIASTLILASCAVGRGASDERVSIDSKAKPGYGRVIVFRTSTLLGVLRGVDIYFGDTLACSLAAGDAYAFDAPVGYQNVFVGELGRKRQRVGFDLDGEHTVLVRLSPIRQNRN